MKFPAPVPLLYYLPVFQLLLENYSLQAIINKHSLCLYHNKEYLKEVYKADRICSFLTSWNQDNDIWGSKKCKSRGMH